MRGIVGLAVALLFSANTVAVPVPDEAPLRVGLSDSFGIEFAWKAITKEAGILVEAEEISHARRRRMFIEGYILIDCCMTPEWRDTPEENAVQLFTDVFYRSEEVYILRSGTDLRIKEPADLRALRVAVIRGFTYENAEYFGSVVPSKNINSLFTLVERGRAHVAIVSKVDFLHHMAQRSRALEVGGVESVVDMRIRVHKSRAELIPRLNAAIAKLKRAGTLIEMIETPQK
ncbi:MAG: transporter substrate-binding domain-containing protein [Kordiimonadaceae bacterium]|nr:transporter substrate-binding domain-containing protein [Kordiimonadaceae bacterium]